jgi:hypothetical protein
MKTSDKAAFNTEGGLTKPVIMPVFMSMMAMRTPTAKERYRGYELIWKPWFSIGTERKDKKFITGFVIKSLTNI